MPSPAPRSSKRTLIIVLVAAGALIVLCCLGGVGFVVNRDTYYGAVNPQQPQFTDLPSTDDSPGGGATTNLAVGQTASFSNFEGAWTVTLTSRTWRDTSCSTNRFFPTPKGKLLIIEVTFEVTSGTASIFTLDFYFTDPAGGSLAVFSPVTGCNDPSLGTATRQPAGTIRRGKIVIDALTQTGQVTYAPLSGRDIASGSDIAAWAITP